MPFKKGRGALRRTLDFLNKGQIVLRDNVKVITFAYIDGPKHSHHQGLTNFVFWHLPQLQYKNSLVQMVTFRMLTPTPWIKAYLDDDSEVLIDCDSRSRQEIHDHVQKILGKTKEKLLEEHEAATISANLANFGPEFARQCICEVPGHVPCPGWHPLPKEMTGKWKQKMLEDE